MAKGKYKKRAQKLTPSLAANTPSYNDSINRTLTDIDDDTQRFLPSHDRPQFFLLIALYFIQGIPIGLTFGTIPFLLKSIVKETSFTQLGVFSMATYPYSLKIIWSPIVDSIYNRRIGRRRSWIIPIQLISGVVLYLLGVLISNNHLFKSIDDSYHGRVTPLDDLNINITQLTFIFTSLIFLCATQDIAVDGWALTILSKQSLSYAATAQTIGLNIGYFLSFTVFIAFNSMEFINKYFRSLPLEYGWVSLGGYMKFSGVVYVVVTLYIIFKTNEHPMDYQNSDALPSNSQSIPVMVEYEDKDLVLSIENKDKTQDILYVYSCFKKVLKLGPVQTLAIMHLLTKFAFQCNEAATNLKLLEKGFKKEDLAVTVLIDFPFEIIFGYYVAKWSSDASDSNNNKENEMSSSLLRNNASQLSAIGRLSKYLAGDTGVLSPWLYGFLGRLVAAILGSYVVKSFPEGGEITNSYFILVIIQHLLGSFMQTVQFVCISSFHTRIADPILGGTYMTLLNTLSNFGGTWPRFLIMWMINHFTVYRCINPVDNSVTYANNLKDSNGVQFCQAGTPSIMRDGYFITNFFCITVGICLYFSFLRRKAQYLQALPIESWRCKM